MEPRISIITLGVSDLPRSVRFYRDGLGFPTSATEDAAIAFFRTGGTVLALYRMHSVLRASLRFGILLGAGRGPLRARGR